MSSYKKFGYEFVLIDVYVDDLNTIGTLEELSKVIDYLNKGFKMKDLEKKCFASTCKSSS